MSEPLKLSNGITMRPLSVDDAAELLRAYARNRTHLSPWEPARPDEFYTEAGQVADMVRRTAAYDAREGCSLGVFDGASIVGRLDLSGAVRGPLQSAWLGYWIDHDYVGRGLATAAVKEAIRIATEDLKLHRVEASTLLHNSASQQVLIRSGFQQIGMAPAYLHIDGAWRDHNLYQRILHD